MSDFIYYENVTHAHICAAKALDSRLVYVAGKVIHSWSSLWNRIWKRKSFLHSLFIRALSTLMKWFFLPLLIFFSSILRKTFFLSTLASKHFSSQILSLWTSGILFRSYWKGWVIKGKVSFLIVHLRIYYILWYLIGRFFEIILWN